MPNLPLDFISNAHANSEFQSTWTVESGNHQAACAIPSEFGGAGGGFSPEDLYLQSLMSCFIGTFKVYAKASRVSFSSLSIQGKLTVDQDQTKKTFMKSVFMNIRIQGADRPDRIETLVAKTMRDGFILNSVKSEIQYKLEMV